MTEVRCPLSGPHSARWVLIRSGSGATDEIMMAETPSSEAVWDVVPTVACWHVTIRQMSTVLSELAAPTRNIVEEAFPSGASVVYGPAGVKTQAARDLDRILESNSARGSVLGQFKAEGRTRYSELDADGVAVVRRLQ